MLNEKEVKILHIEDNSSDTTLVERYLCNSRIKSTIVRVQTREEFLQKLGEFLPDIILADVNIPGFGGFAALEIVQGRGNEIPFVFVTGVTDAEAVIAAFRKGAADYVLKSRLVMDLATAVKRALEKSKLVAPPQELLAICSYCKNIRGKDNAWIQIESYFTHVGFSHAFCPACEEKHVKPTLDALRKEVRDGKQES